MSRLSPADHALLEGEPPDPDARPAFNDITGCLVWADEIPDGLSREGYALVRDLLTARGKIHRGVPLEDWDYGYGELWATWNDELASGLRWNGFRRLALTGEERAMLRRYLATGDEL